MSGVVQLAGPARCGEAGGELVGFLAPGVVTDFVLSTEDYPGHAVERYLREEAPDAAMTVRIVTLSNPADEE